ncbi:DNA polymerase I, putative [Babesia ovata]|uniref:DNA polymerase I, putative n=1 Tax=Babesia ovata TaxID=189622 RepID=A0A2H6KEM4_9APIC|nr:DNA polymerase I, putative [Babesia ovata]GBE61443.1 DNA polymerase I, putative [Babesia ovata]
MRNIRRLIYFTEAIITLQSMLVHGGDCEKIYATSVTMRSLEDTFWDVRKRRKLNDSRIHKPDSLRPSHAYLWGAHPGFTCHLSEVSSSSSGFSKVSRSEGSISSVSSSGFTVITLEEGEIDEKKATVKPATGVIGTKIDNSLDIKTHIDAIKKDVKRLKLLTTLIGARASIPNLLNRGLKIIKRCHQTTCVLASVYMLLKKSGKGNAVVGMITECLTEQFGVITALHAQMLNNDGDDGLKWIIEAAPYSVDMLMTIIPHVINCTLEVKEHKNLVLLFEALVHSTLLKCCSVSDNSEHVARISAVKSIFYILTALLPISPVIVAPTGDALHGDTDTHERSFAMFNLILSDYIQHEEFQASSLSLYQLQCTLGITGPRMWTNGTLSGGLVRKITYRIAYTAVIVGCTKRQFPVGHVDASNYGLDEVARTLSMQMKQNHAKSLGSEITTDEEIQRIWGNAKYWLLSLLEDNSGHVRNTAIRIIRHAVVTVRLAEKDRQHILSLVTDCVSDAITIENAMGVLVAVSHLYPLKDGAVRRISNLTLKGSGVHIRTEIIRLLGHCHFTHKGKETALSVLHNLCEPKNNDEPKAMSVQCATSSIFSDDTEIRFAQVEWPEILKTLANLAHKNVCVASSDFMHQFVKGVHCPATHWIGIILGNVPGFDPKLHFIHALLRSEAAMRFPGIVNIKTTPSETITLVDCGKIFSDFLRFSKHAITIDCLKGKLVYLHIHHLRYIGRIVDIQKVIDTMQNEAKMGTNGDTGKKCQCIDCATDKIIMSSKHKRAFKNVDDDKPCSAYNLMQAAECETGSDESLKALGKQSKVFRAHAVFSYYRNFSQLWTDELEAIDDVDCIAFPSHIGALVVRSFQTNLRNADIILSIRGPTVMGMGRRKGALSLSFRSQCKQGCAIMTKLHITHAIPTVYPIPIKVTALLQGKNVRKVSYPIYVM